MPSAYVQDVRLDDYPQMLLFKIGRLLAAATTGYSTLHVATAGTAAATVTRAGFTSGLTASQTLLAANTKRLYFTIDNRTGVDVFLRKGTDAATTAVGGYDLRVPSGFSVSDDSWTGAITFICAAGALATGVNVSESSTA